jgi:hypothetical protein
MFPLIGLVLAALFAWRSEFTLPAFHVADGRRWK